MPHYDIIASDETGRHVSVQVKAATRGSWQFGKMTDFCEITFDGQRQIVGAPKACPVRGLVMVFVQIAETGSDRFCICTWHELRDLLIRHHRAYLEKYQGVRPKKWDSLHCGIKADDLVPFQDRWDTVEENLA